MENLRPCPFCGGEAKLVRKDNGWLTKPIVTICDSWLVRCQTCGCSTEKFMDDIHRSNDGELVVKMDGVAKAVAAWNNRPEEE